MSNGALMFDTETCVGCRSCELACSYHHEGIFRPSISSIAVLDKPEELGFALLLYAKSDDGRLSCDNCTGFNERFCVKYCSPLMKDELSSLIDKFLYNS